MTWTKDLRQNNTKFVPICWKMTRNKTNLLCARASKNRPRRKGTLILSSEQEMKAGFMVMTQEHSNSHLSGRVVLLPSKSVEADEFRLQEFVVFFLEQWGSSSEGVFSSVPAFESAVQERSTKGFHGSCREKTPESVRHKTGFCIMTAHLATWIHGFFHCLTKKRW